MFHSTLLIDTGNDPRHPRPGRRWIGKRYRVHQRLCMAFPRRETKERDPHFLAPFVPTDFCFSSPVEPPTNTHVHEKRAETTGFLFRIDPVSASVPSRHVIIVQSAIEPDWDYAFHNAREFLCAKPLVRPFNPSFTIAQKLRFRLRANPTKRIAEKNKQLGTMMAHKRIGLLTETEQIHWLLRKAESSGFRVPGEWVNAKDPETGKPIQLPNFCLSVVPEGRIRNDKPEDKAVPGDKKRAVVPEGRIHTDKPCRTGEFIAVRFDGVLIVTDPVAFAATVAAGIGSAKAYGFGLLSVAPANV